MQTYLFYDIETTGLNKAFDQVLQFAAIRTDVHLKELDRYELNIKLNPDVIPSPYALITHHIGLKDMSHGLNEFSAIKQIHQWLNHPGTISLGYNTLGFDDEFLRFSFYRNLLPPYTHQFANDCSRMDLYPITLMYYLYKPHVLQWPTIDGKKTFKLEHLSSLNQLATGRAHNAMVDVEATLALAQRFFAERDMWNYIKGYFNKKIDQERLQALPTTFTFNQIKSQTTLTSNQIHLSEYDKEPCGPTSSNIPIHTAEQIRKNQFDGALGLMIDGRLREQNYQTPVLYLGMHRHYKNQLMWLRLDSPDLLQTTEDTVSTTTARMINKKKLGEPNFILPLKDRFTAQLPEEHRKRAQENQQWLTQHPDKLKTITDYYTEYKYPVFPDTDIDASLYLNGFYSADDEKFCRLFHCANPTEKARLTEYVKNPALYQLAIRILGRHYPEVMTTEQKDKYTHYLKRITPEEIKNALIDFQGQPRMTPQTALSDITKIRTQETLSPEQNKLLQELETYLLNF